jgi:predicted NAD/FAD-binding protein
MSFSVKCERTGLEYNGTNRNTLFAQRSNLVRPSFWRMIRDILRFNREAPRLLNGRDHGVTLGEYVRAGGYSHQFLEHYLRPMGAAVWSAEPAGMDEFPARFFVQFFKNHGFLSVDERPVWRVISGGSSSYIAPLTASFAERIRLSTPVLGARRHDDRVELRVGGKIDPERTEEFDHVIFACHSDQALALLDDASDLEREVLGALPYQRNEAVLHTDTSVLPTRRLAWAAWNYTIPGGGDAERVPVTYNMNILQGLADAPETFLVTLNRSGEIAPDKVLRRLSYHHPIFTVAGVQAQAKRWQISGVHRTHFAGAYWTYGFHEDGVKSAIAVARAFGQSFDSSYDILKHP